MVPLWVSEPTRPGPLTFTITAAPGWPITRKYRSLRTPGSTCSYSRATCGVTVGAGDGVGVGVGAGVGVGVASGGGSRIPISASTGTPPTVPAARYSPAFVMRHVSRSSPDTLVVPDCEDEPTTPGPVTVTATSTPGAASASKYSSLRAHPGSRWSPESATCGTGVAEGV